MQFGLFCGLLVAIQPAYAAPPTEQQKKIDAAVVLALDYLSRQQLPAGNWKSESFGEATSMTALPIMAFLAAGHVPGEGPYATTLQRGIRWVVSHQQPNGMLVHQVKSHGPMYCHGICTLMLAEVVGMVSEDDAKPVRVALERGVKVILDAQNLNKLIDQAGGWRYQPTSRDSDLSVTGWQLLALRAAKNAGCDVPAENIDRAVAYVKRCSMPQNKGFAYQPRSGATAVRTGTGILALEICGEHHAAESLGGADFLLSSFLKYEDAYFFYGAYYCGVGMFQIGGKQWDQTRDLLYELLLSKQSPDGSWLAGNSGEQGAGRIYATSLAVLSLAVEYQFLPIYQR